MKYVLCKCGYITAVNLSDFTEQLVKSKKKKGCVASKCFVRYDKFNKDKHQLINGEVLYIRKRNRVTPKRGCAKAKPSDFRV